MRGTTGTPTAVELVRDAVRHQRVHARPGEQDARGRDAAGRRIAVAGGAQVAQDVA